MWSFLTLPTPNDARPRPPPPSSPSSTASAPSSTSNSSATSSSPTTDLSAATATRNRPLALLLCGATFTLLSARLTRRAVVKRRLATKPHFYHPSNERPLQPISGAFEAFEALSLATVNVASWAVLWSGGVLWGLDVRDMAQLRKKVRGGLGVDGTGRAEGEVEEDLEEWLARILEKSKTKGTITQEDLEEATRLNDRGKPR